MVKEETAARIQRAQEAVGGAGLDLLFIVGRENLIYFTGSTQFECMALIIPAKGEASAVTLWLDTGYLREISAIPNVVGYYFPTQNLVSKAVEVIKGYGFVRPRIGFEKYFVEFSVYDGLRQAFPEENFVNAAELIYKLRSLKSPYEVGMIAGAAEMVCKGMDAAIKAVRPGIMELEVLAEAEYAMMKAGSGGSPFRMQVVSGDRALLTHPSAGQKKLMHGEAVVIHLGATCEGYCAKMCRTVALGEIPDEQVKIYELLKDAQEKAILALRPGVRSYEVDAAARAVIEQAGYGRSFLDHTGYGVGLRQSEFYPIIGKGRGEVLEEGMVIDLLLPTIYKKDVGGPRITDCVYLSASGPHVLTDYPRDLIYK